MAKNYVYYCLILAFAVTALQNFLIPPETTNTRKNYKVGQVAEEDVIAPYDFEVKKSKQQIEAEKRELTPQIKPAYRFSDETQFNAFKTLDEIFLPLAINQMTTDTSLVAKAMKQYKVQGNTRVLLYLSKPMNARYIHELLQSELTVLYTRGLYAGISSDSIYLHTGNKVRIVRTSEMISIRQATERVLSKTDNTLARLTLESVLPILLKPNVIYDARISAINIESEYSKLPKIEDRIIKNEIIVRRNTRLTEQDINRINSMLEAGKSNMEPRTLWNEAAKDISCFVYFLLLGLLLYWQCSVFYPDLLNKKYHFFPLVSGLILAAILSLLGNRLGEAQTLIVPFSSIPIAMAILIDAPFALFYNILCFAGIALFQMHDVLPILVFVISSTGVILLIGKMKEKHHYLIIWITLVILSCLFTALISVVQDLSLRHTLQKIGYAFSAASMSIIILVLCIPYIEKKWNLATRQELLTLLDFNHPLLKKLALEAIGTYYHSLVVGNLAERAAEAIGANALLARVGSYYHDIGKITNPEFFTENNPASADIHDKIEAADSASGIKNHIPLGISLAEKYHLPVQVRDIILQHHGTGYIRYFLDKAEKSGAAIDLESFKYGGPKPNSKEAVLVMIADIVESTTKSWNEINPEDIRKILNDTIFRLIKEGQFDESPISLKEINLAKESMVPILESIYRKRQQYPEQIEDDRI